MLHGGRLAYVQAQAFYQIDAVNTIEITFPHANWNEVLEALYAAGDEERLIGTAVINGIRFDSVGVRYKGNSSYRVGSLKKPLNIKLDHVHLGQTLDGYGTLKLSNGFKDPSLVREVLSFEIARKYMPASLANFINVYINGQLIGIYTSVQSVDKNFLETHFLGSENAFFKGEIVQGPPPPGCPTGAPRIWGYLGNNPNCYSQYYEMRSDAGWEDLIAFIDTLNRVPDAVENVVNVDRLLWMLAFDILMVNLDAPINFAHNYYLYKDDTGQFNPIVWDLNENMGVFRSLLNTGGGGPNNRPLNLAEMQRLDPFLRSTHPGFPIIQKVLSNPMYRKMYVAHLKTIMDDNFSNGWYESRALELQDIIDTHVRADPHKPYSYNDFKNNVHQSISGNPESVIGIAELMESRIVYISNHPDFQHTPPAILDINHLPKSAPPHSDVWIQALVSYAENVVAVYRSNPASPFKKIQMHDDGLHNDGLAGDNLFGVSISINTSDIQYYLYAENLETVVFSPERAAYDYFSVPVDFQTMSTHHVVINEFMASNEGTVVDPHGEYEDWIELYNTTSEETTLDGVYLSDDFDNRRKWAFPPNTSIAPGEYLLVWADEDGSQDGLHTNFRLARSGEEIWLGYADGTAIDTLTFGEQIVDVSFGRSVGSDNWQFFYTPTPGYSNGSVTHSEDTADLPTTLYLFQNYPNPFNPQTTIQFELPKTSEVRVVIYDALGRLVRSLMNRTLPAGNHKVTFQAGQLSSGVYYCHLITETHVLIRPMVLMH